MKKLVIAIMGLGLFAAACGTTKGYVTDKDFRPGYSGVEYTVDCGLAIDGSYDCGKFKAKWVTRPDRWYLDTTDGNVRVSHDVFDACEEGDWYDGDRCYDERPTPDNGSQPAR